MNAHTDHAVPTGSRSRDRRRAEPQLPEPRGRTGSAVARQGAKLHARRARDEGAGTGSPDTHPASASSARGPKRARPITHIMIPADDGPGSRRAFEYGVELARRFGARITGFHAMPDFAGWVSLAEQLEQPPQAMFPDARARAGKVFAPLKRRCRQAGVRCEVVSETAANPGEAIIAAATRLKCDLIVMASHGRVGVARLMLGSETRNVLDHCDLPVFVVR